MKNKSPFQEHCQTGTTVPAGLPLFLIGGIFMNPTKREIDNQKRKKALIRRDKLRKIQRELSGYKKINLTCAICGKSYIGHSNGKYCSDACRRIKHKTYIKSEYVTIKSRYAVYRDHCERTGRIFEITIDDFTSITSQPCFYCGSGGRVGIDRVNNLLGYVDGNMVACCTVCNKMKHTLSMNDFIKKCKAIAYKC